MPMIMAQKIAIITPPSNVKLTSRPTMQDQEPRWSVRHQKRAEIAQNIQLTRKLFFRLSASSVGSAFQLVLGFGAP